MKQIQRQQLQQKLSPQQIQLMRLLQLPVTELEQAIKEEIEKNPLLDATPPENEQSIDTLAPADNNTSDWDSDEELFDYDYREHLESDPNTTRREFIISDSLSFSDRLNDQLISRNLTHRQRLIANELIGTLDDAGYLSRDLDLITNDLAFRQGIDATRDEVLQVLHIIQSLEPAGIGARNLQECLLLQLERLTPDDSDGKNAWASEIVRNHFDDFANHRYERICSAIGISQQQLDEASSIIRHLNPKPGNSETDSQLDTATFTPDIILQQHDGELLFYLNDGNLPRLSLNSYYSDMLADMEKTKNNPSTKHPDNQALQFLRTKKADAQSFIDLLQQRHDTIARVMRYIVKHQRQFLLTGDPDLMHPMRQREVADATGLDISTVSRMANSKYIQTDFGTIPLKECFSKGMANEAGEEVSVEAIKQRLSNAIVNEDKHSPLSDEALAKLLNSQGYPLARRTVAKYREQLGFPIARLRRTLILLALFLSPLIFRLSPASAQNSYYDSLISIRLEAAQRQNQHQEQKNQEKNTRPPAAKQQPQRHKPQNRLAENDEPQTSNSPLSNVMVPLWYNSFPHNRVNPMGRTRVDMMPDEIILKLVNDSNDFCFPVKRPKTSNYGWRWERGHQGVDIGLAVGEPVHCAFGGIVRVATTMGGYGNCIVIRHPNGLETLYGHLSKINVKTDQQVEAGEVIGLGGNTGNSTGPHLHFECRFLYQSFDPEWILDFSNYTLRTRRLHLDKSYFGIHQPRKGQTLEYKADSSIIKESKSKKRRSNSVAPAFDINDF